MVAGKLHSQLLCVRKFWEYIVLCGRPPREVRTCNVVGKFPGIFKRIQRDSWKWTETAPGECVGGGNKSDFQLKSLDNDLAVVDEVNDKRILAEDEEIDK